jgi:hypothetical protein
MILVELSGSVAGAERLEVFKERVIVRDPSEAPRPSNRNGQCLVTPHEIKKGDMAYAAPNGALVCEEHIVHIMTNEQFMEYWAIQSGLNVTIAQPEQAPQAHP